MTLGVKKNVKPQQQKNKEYGHTLQSETSLFQNPFKMKWWYIIFYTFYITEPIFIIMF